MGKISPVSAKYIVHATIHIEGMVDKPDVIGAIFGQTEGLLGNELELRELQRSGRIGRIEVNTETKGGKAQGSIIIPSSLDKAETAIVAASLEIIQRIGPCNAKIVIEKIEDVRISKRQQVIERAKELLKHLVDTGMPDSQELADEVAQSVRVMEIQEYGSEKLPCGPALEESDEIIVVEGRADVINLLKYGIKNTVALNGTSVPPTMIDLCRRKTVIAFVDGDRGGDLIIKELTTVTDVDFVTKAPDGKEVEELTQKEILKALRSKISPEQVKSEGGAHGPSNGNDRYQQQRRPMMQSAPSPGRREMRPMRPAQAPVRTAAPLPQGTVVRRPIATARAPTGTDEKKAFGKMLEDLIGTRGAYILDAKLNILGKVPSSELSATIKSLNNGVHAVVFDGMIEEELVDVAETCSVKYLIAMGTKVKPTGNVQILTADEL
ncbi:DNA primase [Candidatus Woesearchaeota archaeon]|nr:DNA primase [Candidatus Woesearchaeota archaeon]